MNKLEKVTIVSPENQNEDCAKFTIDDTTNETFYGAWNVVLKWILENTENLEYVEMKDFDSCCGLNGITKLDEYKILSKIYKNKHNNIINSGTKIVLTSCLGCETALSAFCFGQYKVQDFTEFLVKNIG